jgi:hypothetical protein
MSPGICIMNRDEHGLIRSMSIVVRPCANEPDPDARDERGIAHAWQHGLADMVFDDGATFLCRACGEARQSEEARRARLRALPPFARAFLERHGLTDWRRR